MGVRTGEDFQRAVSSTVSHPEIQLRCRLLPAHPPQKSLPLGLSWHQAEVEQIILCAKLFPPNPDRVTFREIPTLEPGAFTSPVQGQVGLRSAAGQLVVGGGPHSGVRDPSSQASQEGQR